MRRLCLVDEIIDAGLGDRDDDEDDLPTGNARLAFCVTYSPLMTAIRSGNDEMAKELLERGAARPSRTSPNSNAATRRVSGLTIYVATRDRSQLTAS